MKQSLTPLAGTVSDHLSAIDLFFKNFFDSNTFFAPQVSIKVPYPVDIYKTEKGLYFELAVVGLEKEDINILTEMETIRVYYHGDKQDDITVGTLSVPLDNFIPSLRKDYIYKGIARRSFDLAWKVSTDYDLNKLEAKLDRGLLSIFIPINANKQVKKVSIK